MKPKAENLHANHGKIVTTGKERVHKHNIVNTSKGKRPKFDDILEWGRSGCSRLPVGND